MRPTQILLGGGGSDAPLGRYNKYLGGYGGFGTPVQKQKGIVTYGLAPNRQNPFAGAAHAAVFNTWRRFSAQVLYVVPPFIAAYYIMNWAVERNHYLNSKAGIAEFASDEEE
ncbi:Cytochrome b-c1 complex subunit 8, mitochondrial [Cytospora paraplurivora]|uniref:Cytochrome b-c1 complex subunit 8 n=1 Tax=Cytospora paraplurivora TaxID=2898453 RepID=A0AAN9UB31_9PEZI